MTLKKSFKLEGTLSQYSSFRLCTKNFNPMQTLKHHAFEFRVKKRKTFHFLLIALGLKVLENLHDKYTSIFDYPFQTYFRRFIEN